MKQIYADVLYLLGCAANGQKADQNRIKAMDLQALYTLCRAHSITALVGSVLCEAIQDRPEEHAKWHKEQMKAVYRDVNFAAEREQILSFLEESGIWHMPLKGIVLKNYYPRPELREFADNDFLFDKTFENDIDVFMRSSGYTRKQTDEGHVMEYEKPPCFYMEMHRSLYHTNNTLFYNYYEHVKDRLIKDADKDFGYHFSDEDFYIFMLSHAYRHYRDSGVGIRSLLDIFIFNRAKGASLNRAYIQSELKKIETDVFEHTMRQLAQKVFGGDCAALTAEEEQIIDYYFRSGTYGTKEMAAMNAMKTKTGDTDFSAKGRRKYWLKRLFDMDLYKREYPRAYKSIVLIPFLIVFRFFRGLTKTKDIQKENERLKGIEQKEGTGQKQ